MSKNQGLAKKDRLSVSVRIRTIQSRGQRYHAKAIAVSRLVNNQKSPRIAIAITKKAGISAVRNRAKRVIREFFRKNKKALGCYDYVFYTSKDISQLSKKDWLEITQLILKWCER